MARRRRRGFGALAPKSKTGKVIAVAALAFVAYEFLGGKKALAASAAAKAGLPTGPKNSPVNVALTPGANQARANAAVKSPVLRVTNRVLPAASGGGGDFVLFGLGRSVSEYGV